ncbi:MAG: hypothetical protein EA395_11010 [Phormidium sp. GEM2.Bin31]|nr:MAG: hypothetical protein EA395_11010 [Phormidium sp. GEM2.Bin31]
MANPHIWTPIKRWLRNTSKRAYAQFTRLVRRLLHRVALPRRRRSQRQGAGFVLPTAIMLLLVLSLIVGAILLRTVSRTEQAMLSRRDRIIYNAATPAIDRAKAKLEYLFQVDPRLPSGIPSQNLLTDLMLDVNRPDSPYNLPGETRLTLNGQPANAWVYTTDDNLKIAYSILWEIPNNQNQLTNQSSVAINQRANDLQVRQGPIASETRGQCNIGGAGTLIENGWLQDQASSAILRKNFQINAFVISDGEDGAVTTLEVQQERQADRGNKWGAWFRNDLEIYPGPEFRWNGAMHSDGSIIVGHAVRDDRTQAYLVSSPNSCIYQAGPTTSEITMSSEEDQQGNILFRGQLMVGRLVSNQPQGGGIFHLWTPQGEPLVNHNTQPGRVTLSQDDDSVSAGSPNDIALDPIRLFTEDVSEHRGNVTRAQGWSDFPEPATEDEQRRGGRVFNEPSERPFIDDFYRADDRFGPKPVYGGDDDLQLAETQDANGELVGMGVRTGDPIPNSGIGAELSDKLLQLEVPGSGDPRELGLDGYWERRAWREGLRVIVGQRLELGNEPFAGTTEVATNPTSDQIARRNHVNRDSRAHEYLQHRTLRDNLAAVQTTALYHYTAGNTPDEEPLAAVLTTVHPGTGETLKRAAMFEKPRIPFQVNGQAFGDDDNELLVDFFTGRGTNGLELNLQNFGQGSLDVNSTASEIRRALDNLANLAGDPEGAFPAVQEAGEIHPNPAMTEWGDFSNLRRSLDPNQNLNSLADYSNRHTAALTLGALAYNVNYLEGLDYGSISGPLGDLAEALRELRDGDLDNGEVLFFPTEDLGDLADEYDYDEDFNGDGDANDAIPSLLVFKEGELVTRMTPSPQAYVEALDDPELQELARLVYLKEQILRDRTFGFLPSPTGEPEYQSERNITLLTGVDETTDFEQDIDVAAVCEEMGLGEDCLEIDNVNDDQVRLRFAPGLALNHYDEDDGWYESSDDTDAKLVLADDTLSFNLSMSLGCNLEDAENNFFGFGSENPDAMTLASTLCGATPQFPSLYYLFPVTDHGLLTNADLTEDQPQSEADVDDEWVAEVEDRGIMDLGPDLNNDGDTDNDDIWYTGDPTVELVNGNVTYRAIDIADIVIEPTGNPSNFQLPYIELSGQPSGVCDNSSTNDDPNPNCQRNNLIYLDDTYYRVAFKDTAFFAGRDMMSSRALNFDAAMLSGQANNLQNSQINGDLWLTQGDDDDGVQLDGGIVYAFREDGVREDGVERPGSGSCQTASAIGSGCNSNVLNNFDPLVNPENGISPKAVNFVPDPDRRVHGFRIINGQDISRQTNGNMPFGMSFISDNPTFIQGNFNCHMTDGNCNNAIEEFNNTLGANWGPNEFYGRQTLNQNFARPNTDSWRNSEFLVDAIGIVSDNFCDGSLEDPFIIVPALGGSQPAGNNLPTALNNLERGGNGSLRNVYGCSQTPVQNVTSYLGLPRPNNNSDFDDNVLFLRENPADPASPIRISANGDPMLFTTREDYDGSYFSMDANEQRPLIHAREPQRVNAVMVSGITPSRTGQSYGGLHNFPRLLEDWNPTRNFANPFDLFISGSFLQLSFSNYATGPYDQGAWEPGATPPENGEVIDYYFAPQRLWGYDVALQLARVGPVSSRLITVSRARSEFYREPSADDPYIRNLRCAIDADGDRVDPRANCS